VNIFLGSYYGVFHCPESLEAVDQWVYEGFLTGRGTKHGIVGLILSTKKEILRLV
jgi:hypothetical protein